jgi:cell division septation protein DedD
MQDNRWIGWLGLIILFLIFQGARAVIRAAKNGPSASMARMNAAAERILKERGASTSNLIPRTHAKPTGANPMGAKPTRGQIAAAKPRHSPAIMKTGATPAVIRRGSFLGGKEPVIQRRR